MKSWTLPVLLMTLILSTFAPLSAQAQSEADYNRYSNLFESYQNEDFKEEELKTLFDILIKLPNNRSFVPAYIKAVKTPHAPIGSHTGERFFKSLSWYNDTTKGNRDGLFTLQELNTVFDNEVRTYLTHLQKGAQAEVRLSSWKMLQKLKLLQKEILRLKQPGYYYEPRAMFDIDHDSPWNRNHTINGLKDFQENEHQTILFRYW